MRSFVFLSALLVAGSTFGAVAHAEGENVDLEPMLAPFAGADANAKKEAMKTVVALGPEAVPAITKKLAELRKSPQPVATVLKQASTEDALVALPQSDQPYRTTVTTFALMHALEHIGTMPAVRQLVKVAADHNGAFKPEIIRELKALGDKAIPGLIETRKESPELRHWAVAQLEAMGKRVPGDAVQTKDNQVLSDVLRAYADVHDMDALPVTLSFVNSDRIQVRTAAREAIAQFGQDAVWKVREAYGNVIGKPAPDGWSAAQIEKELFAAYDRLRLQEVYGLLDEGLAKEKEGKLDDAIAAFDKVLARQPLLDRRGEMVPAYVAYATSLEDTDPPRALAIFRKAERLWPESPRAKSIQAEIAYLEGKDLLARGIADTTPFKRALELDPGHEKARAELTRLETNVEERQQRIRYFAAGGAVLVVGLLGIILFGGSRRRRPLRTA